MKKILLLMLWPIAMQAQSGFFIRPHIARANTMFYNAEDTKNATNSIFGTMPLPMHATYVSNYGLYIGKEFTLKNKKKFSIITGINYNPFKQNYEGVLKFDTMGFFGTHPAKAYRQLNFIQIPILAEYNFMQKKKWTLFVNAGINISFLLSYQENTVTKINEFGSDLHPEITTTLPVIIDVNNNNYNQNFVNDPYLTKIGIMDKWYYKKVLMNSHIGIGAKYSISNKIELVGAATFNLGLNSIQNNTKITYTYTDSIYQGITEVRNPSTYYYAFIKARKYWNDDKPRPQTFVMQTNAQIGINFKF
jgi:Outer membrane protein beta-barrel domain